MAHIINTAGACEHVAAAPCALPTAKAVNMAGIAYCGSSAALIGYHQQCAVHGDQRQFTCE